MEIRKREWWLIIFNLAYLIPFTYYFLSIRDFEFLFYIGLLVAIFCFIGATLRKTGFDYLILWGLSIWGLLHVAGGGVMVGDAVLYRLQLIPIVETSDYFILRYDQFVHFYLYMLVSMALFHVLSKQMKRGTRFMLYLVTALASIGIGALNEVAEFSTVLALERTGVGGYYNTAWDIVFNVGGAILGTVIAAVKRK